MTATCTSCSLIARTGQHALARVLLVLTIRLCFVAVAAGWERLRCTASRVRRSSSSPLTRPICATCSPTTLVTASPPYTPHLPLVENYWKEIPKYLFAEFFGGGIERS